MRSCPGRLVLALLVLRLVVWALLLPPWEGFDEPFHHGYVMEFKEGQGWAAFHSVMLPARLVDEIHRWPRSTESHAARPSPGTKVLRTTVSASAPNYETQQSPLYYFLTGRLLALLPDLSPISELYLLRLLNAALAAGVGLVTLRAGQNLLGSLFWLPVLMLSLVPGYGLAMARVTNDAFCALLASLAVAAALPRASPYDRGLPLWGSLAAGTAPWAKLYGWFALGAPLWRLAQDRRRVLVHTSLLLLPGMLLTYLSWKLTGHPLPIQENLLADKSRSIVEVPWARGGWGILKTWIWASGASAMTFVNGLYVPAVLLIVAGFVTTLRAGGVVRKILPYLLVPVAMLAAGMAYHSWRMTAAFGPAVSMGWYVWAAALPLALLVTLGVGRSARPARFVLPAAGFFLLLTVLADTAIFLLVSDRLRATPNRHILGFDSISITELWDLFFASRPRVVALAAIVAAVASWLLAGYVLARCRLPAARADTLRNTQKISA